MIKCCIRGCNSNSRENDGGLSFFRRIIEVCNMSLNNGIGQNGWYEQIAAEFIKYECLSYPGPPNEKIMGEINKAYTDIAKTLSLTDIQAVKTEILNMKKYIYKMMRCAVRLSILHGGGGQDALNYAPPWFKLLDPRLNLLKLTCKKETLQNLKRHYKGNRVGHFTSEIVRCVCRAAARELARDCTTEEGSKPSNDSTNEEGRGLAGDNGEISKLAKDSTNWGVGELARDCTTEGGSKTSNDSTNGEGRGLAGDNGEISKLAKDSTNWGVGELARDSTNGWVSALKSFNTNGGARDLDISNTIGGVGASAIDSTDRAARAAITLVSEDAVREYAENVDMPVNVLHSLWVRLYAQSIRKLMSLIAAGDQASENYAPIEWLAFDAGLLYNTYLTVVTDKTFQSSVTLHPLILLYKLMVAAHKKIKEKKILPNLTPQNKFQNIIGAQTGTQENVNINIPSSSSESIPDTDTSERNSDGEMRVDGNKSNELETDRAKDVYEREKSRHIWALVHVNYILSGRSSSAVLLQRRWHEMKQKTRQLLAGKDAPRVPLPILLALAKQFPSILTEKLPPWSELVLDNLIYQDSQLEPYRRLYAGMRLEIPNQIGENLILDDLYDWSDDEIEVIDENRETIIVPDSDDEEKDKGTNEQTDTSVNNTTIDNNTSELNDEYDSIKKLESIDPNKAKVQIIFDNDSDDDLNDFINTVNDPGASKNTDSDITTVIEGLNNNNKLLEVTQTSELNEIKNNEYNKTNVINSVSNEIETQVRPDNHKQNVGIDMDEEISDLRNTLICASSNVSNKDIQIEDTGAADEMCDDEDEHSSDDEGERPDPLLFDKKLIQSSHVVLTPIEDLPEWRKHSRNNIIKCRQFSVKNFTKKVHVTSKQLENCRPYISKKSTNGIWFLKNQELCQIPKDIRKKINILSKRLNLSRTYFSQEFWSERNLELVELCRPFSIQLKWIPRVIKKIELADIDDVRRINRTILTAQVAPITVEANRVFVIDSSAPSTTAERIQERSRHNSTDDESPLNKYKTQKTNLPSNLMVVQEDEKISDYVAEENLPTPNLPEDNTTKSLDSNVERDELPSESAVKEMIKKIVRKGDLPKASDPEYILVTQDNDYFSKQKDLERDLRQISKAVLKQYFNSTENETPNKRKNKKRVKKQPNPIPNENTLDSLEEWKRQKQQNLIYFNLNTNLDVNKKSDKHVNQYTNKKKNGNKEKTNAEVNLHKDNDKQSKDTSEILDSSDYSENVINRTTCELNQYTNNKKKDKKDKSNATVNLHKENGDSQTKDTCKISDSSDCNEKVTKRTCCGLVTEVPTKSPRLEISDKAINAPIDMIEVSDDSSDRDIKIISKDMSNNINTESPNNQNQSQININIIQNTIQIIGSDSNEQQNNGGNEQQNNGGNEQQNNEKDTISFLSKVAANIQKNIAPASPQNNNVFYVFKNSESNLTKTILDTNARDVVVETKPVSNSTYYVVNVPDHDTGSNQTVISPLPESLGQMPVIQSVSSLSQQSHQSLNQMPPDVIGLNQAFHNQTQPVINLNQAFHNQIQPVINLNQVFHNQIQPVINLNQAFNNQIQPVINLNQAFHNQIHPVIDLNQVSLNQKPPSIYIYEPSPNQAPL